MLSALRRAAERAGRPPPRVAVGLPIALTDDPGRALEAAERFLAPSARLPAYRRVLAREGASRASDVAIVGGDEELRAELAWLFEGNRTP